MGAATMASLHSDPAFLADLAAAKEEVKAAQKAGLKPTEDCTTESVALSLTQH
jgi:acid phosphatase (class A)